jgi:hypothetical protein
MKMIRFMCSFSKFYGRDPDPGEPNQCGIMRTRSGFKTLVTEESDLLAKTMSSLMEVEEDKAKKCSSFRERSLNYQFMAMCVCVCACVCQLLW